MDEKQCHHVGLFLLFSTLAVTLGVQPGQINAFVVVCFNTGDISPKITVRISGVPNGETLQLPSFVQENTGSVAASDSVSYNFLTFEGSLVYNTTCAFGAQKSTFGSHFVTMNSTLTPDSTITTQVTYENGHVSEGYTAIPIPNLGLEYYAVTFCEIFGHCQIFVVGIDLAASIDLTIKLPNTEKVIDVMYDGQSYGKGDVIITSIGSPESVLIECECDLTGTHISASAKVAVFSGSRNAIVGVYGRKNFLVEQLPPFNKWGIEYVCSCQRYCSQHGAFIRVIAKENTIIHISGYMKVKTTASIPWIHRRIEQDDVVYITADKPILVVMFLLSNQTHPSTMFLIPPVNDQVNQLFFQYPTDRMNKMEMTVFSSKDVQEFSVNNAKVTPDLHYHIQGSQMFASLLKFPEQGNSRCVMVEKTDGRLGMIGVSTGDNAAGQPLRIGFSLGSFHMIDHGDKPPAYPGDGVDNDKDATIDEKDCSADELLDDDCSNKFGSDRDEKGYRFFVVFPYFNSPTRFTVDVMSLNGGSLLPDTTQHIGTCPDVCNVIKGPTSNGLTSLSYVGNCLCMGMNLTGVFQLGTYLRFPAINEYTVSVSIHGATTMATYMALPVAVLGLEYYAVTYCDLGGYCACTVSTVYRSTKVFVKLPLQAAATVGADQYTAGSVIRQTLDIYQTLMFSSKDDLTGTYIKSNAPVALVCGGSSTYATYLEQIPPVFALGSSYYVPADVGMLIRVVATDGNTIITGSGTVTQTVHLPSAGSHADFDLSITSVNATKPVLVVIVHRYQNKDGCMSVMISNSHLTKSHFVKFPADVGPVNIYLRLHTDSTSFSSSPQAVSGVTLIANDSITMSDVLPFFSLMYGHPVLTPAAFFCTSIGRKVSTTEEVCSPSEQTVGDGKDNDCDGLVDEDISYKEFYKDDNNFADVDKGKYILDFDLDGMIDEDCYSEFTVTSTTETSSLEPTTTMIESTYSLESTTTMIESTYSLESTTTMIESTYSLESTTTMIESTYSLEPTKTASHESTTEMTSSMGSPARVCNCPCSLYKPPDPALVNITKAKLVAIVEETKKKLAVNKTNLSSYIRKKNSATDDRPSAAGIGSVGIVMLVLVVVLIVGLDLIFLKQHLRSVRNYRF